MKTRSGWKALFLMIWFVVLGRACWAIDKTPTGFYYPTGKAKFEIIGHGWFGARDMDGYRPQGVWHCGIDISGKLNDPVYAIADGEVVKISRSGWSDNESNPSNFGYLICHTLANGEKFVAIYGHLRRPANLKRGSRVSAGQEIGHLGPWSDGIHLHFGVYQDRKNPTSGNYPNSGHGRQKNPRPKEEVIERTACYGNWFDPIQWINNNMPLHPALPSFPIKAPDQKKERVRISVYTFRERVYGQPFAEINWNKLSRERCTVFRPEERIFVHFEIQGYDPSRSHKVVIAYHLPGKIVGRPEKWVISPESGLMEITIPAGRKKWWRDIYFREEFFYAQPGPRLIEIYLDADIQINPRTHLVDFYSPPLKQIIVRREGELKF